MRCFKYITPDNLFLQVKQLYKIMDKLKAAKQVVIVKDTIEKSKEELVKLQAIIDAPEIWKPTNKDAYYYITGNHVFKCNEDRKNTDSGDLEHGNYYKTKEQGQAVLDLKKHIYSFPRPDVGYHFYWLHYSGNFIEHPTFNDIGVVAYNSGTVITSKSTNKDREERLRLLKLAHNIK